MDRDRRTVSYSAKGTWQVTPTHRIDASFFGDLSVGELGPQRTGSMLNETTSAFSKLDDYGGHNQTVRYDGVLSSKWLVEASFARAYNTITETPSVDQWLVQDLTVVPNVISGGLGFYEKGNKGENLQFAAKSTNILGGHMLRYGVQYEDVTYDQINQRSGPTFVAPDGRETATGAQVSILSDPVFGRIYRVFRANFNSARTMWTYVERAPFVSSWDRWKTGSVDRWTDIVWGYNVIGQFQTATPTVTPFTPLPPSPSPTGVGPVITPGSTPPSP